MRRRFFVDRFESNSAALCDEAADHLGRVLRAEPGQLYELSDGERVWLARTERVALSKRGGSRIEFELVEPVPHHEPTLRTELLIALVKFDRFEWCIEKATELAVHSIVPLSAARTDKALIDAATNRRRRWQKIVLESAQQSRRLRPPVLCPPSSPDQAFQESSAGLKVLLSERTGALPLRDVLKKHAQGSPLPGPCQATLAVGPEGGWTDTEIASARAAGFAEASLGETILRAESAVIAGLAILNFELAR
jgi:16S rRNA (uracil1498-N3)-methyltransferase